MLRHRVEDRGKAIKELALDSGQRFIQGLLSDPGRWRDEQLPLAELQQWAAGGFPKGPGFEAPLRHSKLDQPESVIDFIASRLDAKLLKCRRESQDIANPTDWLTPASAADLESIQALWRLPRAYIEFLSKFSPLRVTIENRRYYQGLHLYEAAELIRRQRGYSYNPVTQSIITDWPADYVVIARPCSGSVRAGPQREAGCRCPDLNGDAWDGNLGLSKRSPVVRDISGAACALSLD